LTKHPVDEGFPKCHIPLDDMSKLVDADIKVLDNNSLGICPASIKSIHNAVAEPSMPTSRVTKPRINSIKTKLGKIMHKLYDLEPDNAPEKPLNVDLGVDLYQMENY
jgi:hypothetical protein